MLRLGHAAIMLCVTAWLASPAMISQAAAQAGDIGGQIGKRNRTISGSQDKPPSQPAPARKSKRASTQRTPGAASPGCGNFFGVWTSGGGAWLYGANDTVFRADGSARHNSGIIGAWRCSSGEIVLEWKNWDNDRLKLSADGKRLNSVIGGKGFTR